MKKLFFPIMLVVTLVVGGAVLLAIWQASPSSSEDFLASGKKYYDEKKYSEATIQLKNAVQKDPKNRDARFMLALTYIVQRDLTTAAKELTSLLEYHKDDTEASLRLGNIFLEVGNSDSRYFREAAKIAAKVLEKDPQNVAALILAGNAAVSQRDYATSLESFEKAVSLDPQNAPAFVSIGTTKTLQRNYPDAETAFLKAREIDPKNKSALISLANYYRAAGDNAKAEAAFKDALAVYPDDSVIYTQLAQLYYQTDRFDDAVRMLKNIQAQDVKTPLPSFVLADLYLAKERPEDARNVLLDLKKTLPENLDVAAKLAVLVMVSDPKMAQAEVERILKADPNNGAGNLLLGEMQYIAGEYDKAQVSLTKPQVANGPFPEAQFFLGNLAMRKLDPVKAQEYLEKAVQMNPRYVAARVALAEVLLNTGKTAEGRKELEAALSLQKTFAPARILMATLNRSEKNYSEAGAELTALSKELPQNPTVHRQMALYHDALGRTAEAEKSLTRALELEPNSFETFQGLVLLNVKAKQFDKAVQRINAVPEGKKVAMHYELLGNVYTQAGKSKDAEAAYKKAAEMDPKRSNADALLASQYIQTGRLDEGIGKLNDLIKKEPANAAALGTKGIIYEKQGKLAEAKESYRAALRANPKMDAAANNLAYILAEEGRELETALDLAKSARKSQPNSPNVADTLGWVYYKLGNQGLAKEQLLFAISKDPNNPVLHYHLGMIYKASKQLKESEAALKKAVASNTDFKEKPLAQSALNEVKAGL
jgi:tetratricopeptide (TPR) repeat protein